MANRYESWRKHGVDEKHSLSGKPEGKEKLQNKYETNNLYSWGHEIEDVSL